MAFNTQHSQRPGSPRRLLLAGKSAVVEGLIGEEQDENQANVVQDGVDPVSPAPIETPDHKRSHERTEIWRSDDEARPDIDLPRQLITKEDVPDPHQAALLRCQVCLSQSHYPS
jgi:hypothetical protein